jgi:hypothetical protein
VLSIGNLRGVLRFFIRHRVEYRHDSEHTLAQDDMLLDANRLSVSDTWSLIGQGAFGRVFAGTLDAQPVCIKEVTRGHAQDAR